MFSTGAVRPLHRFQENADNARVSKKLLNPIQRTPFKDLGVNATPNKNTQTMSKPKNKKALLPLQSKEPDIFVDICSYKEVEDTMEDIWPKSERFNMEKLLCRVATPPPSFTHKPMVFSDIPSPRIRLDILDDYDVPVEEVPMLSIDFMNDFCF